MMKRGRVLATLILLSAPGSARAAESLESYAQKCDAAIGVTVPDFNCDAGTLVPDTHPDPVTDSCDRPNQLNRVCDPGSRFQILVNTDKAFIVAHCRKMGNAAKQYGDIAVIQHNRSNGATCFYQALKEFTDNKRPLDSSVQAPSKGVGSPKFWLTPTDIATNPFPCGGCHDNGPIVRSPYLTQLVTPPNVLPGAGDDTFNAPGDKYYFVGTEFANWKAYAVEVSGNNTCQSCHRLGVNNLIRGGGTARDFAIRATSATLIHKNPPSADSPLWMLKDQPSFSQANADAAAVVKRCADLFSGANLSQPDCKIKQITGPARGPTLGMGGQLTSDPAVGMNADGRLELFARGADDTLQHVWQSDLEDGWSGWNTLNGAIAGRPAVGRNADGRLEVFARAAADNSLWHIWQINANGDWSDWASLGGVLSSEPAVVANADGRLEVFVRGSDNALWHNWQTAPNGDWSGWVSLGGVLVSDPAVATNADGRLEVFVRGTDDALWHLWQTAPNGDWSGWLSMGGTLTSDPVVAANADGHLEVFVRTTDQSIWHVWQTEPNGQWSGWFAMGGVVGGNLAVGLNADGGLELFAQGSDFSVWRRVQSGSEWSDWEKLADEPTNPIVVGRNADGRLQLFARGPDNEMQRSWYVPAWN